MRDTSGALFSKRAKIAIIALVAVGLLTFLAQLILEDESSMISVSSDSFSSSGIGHKALLLFLRDQGISVEVNRHPHGRGIGEKDVLLVLEPEIPSNETKRLSDLLDGNRRVVLALPKRVGIGSMRNPKWIYQSRLREASEVERVAEVLVENPRVRRINSPAEWKQSLYRTEPSIESPQLLVSSELEPIIETEDGVLLGSLQTQGQDFEGREGIYLVSDPDLFNNYGLHRGDNAKLMLELIEWLLPAEGKLYVDESLHGFGQVPSLVALMIAPPFLGVLILVILVTALVSWMTLVPFGKPLETDLSELLAAREPSSGHQTLIENSGRLLASGGFKRHLIERYQWAIMEEVGLQVGVKHHGGRDPEGMGALRHRLNQVLEHRGVSKRLPDLTLARGNLQSHARACHDWMQGVLGGR